MPISNIDELKEALKDNPLAGDIVAFIEASIETEKNTGIAGRRKANAEAQGLRRWKQVIEDAGYEGDPDGVVEWLESRNKAADGGPDKQNPEVEKLRREFQKTQKLLEEERASAQKIKSKSDERAIRAQLSDALGKVKGHKYIIDSLILSGKVKLVDEDQIVFLDGEDEVDFNTGVKRVLDDNADLIENHQAPGARSGTRPQQGTTRYTQDQLKNMSANEIAADMQNVLESMKAMKT